MMNHLNIFYLYFAFRKETPIENQQSCQAQSVNASEASGFESPPNSKRNLDQPPPLTRGKRFLKTVEETEPQTSISNDINIVESVKGYNLRSANDDTIDNKIANTNSLSTAGKKTQRITRKRQAYINEVNEAITKRTKAINSTSVISTPTKSSQLSIDTIYNQTESKGSCNKATQSSTECSTHKTYSELKYLESIGSIRTIRRVKHPGINKVPTSKTDVVTPFISPESQNGWDRKTKLKLSYRIGVLNSNDIQFALIIYEPLTMVSRRNLMEEFQQAALEEAAVAANKNVATTKQNSCTQNSVKIKPKNDKFSSLRRLRF